MLSQLQYTCVDHYGEEEQHLQPSNRILATRCSCVAQLQRKSAMNSLTVHYFTIIHVVSQSTMISSSYRQQMPAATRLAILAPSQ